MTHGRLELDSRVDVNEVLEHRLVALLDHLTDGVSALEGHEPEVRDSLLVILRLGLGVHLLDLLLGSSMDESSLGLISSGLTVSNDELATLQTMG